MSSTRLEGETEGQLHLTRRISVGRCVRAKIGTVGLGAVRFLEVRRVQCVEGLDAELDLARIRPQRNRLVQREVELCKRWSTQGVATGVAEELTGDGHAHLAGVESTAERSLALHPLRLRCIYCLGRTNQVGTHRVRSARARNNELSRGSIRQVDRQTAADD